MMPALAVLLAPTVASRAGALKQASAIVAGLVTLVAIALVIAASRRADEVPNVLVFWSVAAVVIAMACAVLARGRWLVASVGAVLGFQALLVAYSTMPPVRTSKALVAASRRYVGPETELFSVDRVPTDRSGLSQAHAADGGLSRRARVRADSGIRPDSFPRWSSSPRCGDASADAVAFIEPKAYEALASDGVPMYVIARDGRSVVVARHVEPTP